MNIALSILNGLAAAFFVWGLYEEVTGDQNPGATVAYGAFLALFIANAVVIF